jgi:hypothetical protein
MYRSIRGSKASLLFDDLLLASDSEMELFA